MDRQQIIEILGQPNYQGKVRMLYHLPDEMMAVAATDNISVFDFVLPAQVKDKGEILTAMNIFWRKKFSNHFHHDLVGYGPDLDLIVRKVDQSLAKRMVIVRRIKMYPVEWIVRGYLTGSGWASYQKTGEVCGHQLPNGLWNGAKLPEPILAPTTKAKVGHDEHIHVEEVRAMPGGREFEVSCLQLYREASEYAFSRGVIIADTKFEGGEGVIADEILTPDSSRYWDIEDWERAKVEGRPPQSFDKQVVRDYAREEFGLDKLDPENPDHQAQVQALEIDPGILEKTSLVNHEIFGRLTGMSLGEFQITVMHI